MTPCRLLRSNELIRSRKVRVWLEGRQDFGMLPYERLTAWQLCYELTLEVYGSTSTFPKHELYGLTSQARRAAFSAAANIAEGSAKRGSREFRRFLDMAVGSLAELAFILRLAKDLQYISTETWGRLDELRRRSGYVTWRLYRSVAKRT